MKRIAVIAFVLGCSRVAWRSLAERPTLLGSLILAALVSILVAGYLYGLFVFLPRLALFLILRLVPSLRAEEDDPL